MPFGLKSGGGPAVAFLSRPQNAVSPKARTCTELIANFKTVPMILHHVHSI